MTSEPVQKKFAVHTLPNISRGKSNQPMKFGKIIKYNKKMIFFRNHAENVAGRLVSDLLLFFKKDLWLKCKWPTALNLVYNKNKLCKILDYWSRDIIDILETGLGIVSPPNSLNVFLCYIIWKDQKPKFHVNKLLRWINFFPVSIVRQFSNPQETGISPLLQTMLIRMT